MAGPNHLHMTRSCLAQSRSPTCHPPMYPVARVHKSLKLSAMGGHVYVRRSCKQVSQGPDRCRSAQLQTLAETPYHTHRGCAEALSLLKERFGSPRAILDDNRRLQPVVISNALLPHHLFIGHLLTGEPWHDPLHDDVGIIDLTSLCSRPRLARANSQGSPSTIVHHKHGNLLVVLWSVCRFLSSKRKPGFAQTSC